MICESVVVGEVASVTTLQLPDQHQALDQGVQPSITVVLMAEKDLRRVLLTFIVTFAAAARSNAASCTSTTLDALTEFRTAFNDPGNHVFYNWVDDTDCCTWAGITCQNGALTALDLEGPTNSNKVTSNRSYTARPGHTLNKLQELQTLRLRNLQFSARIPSQWSSFSDALVAITVDNCDLQGAIPSGLFSNSKLQRVDLKGNNLTGQVPSRVCDLQELKYLDLSYNDLDVGNVPSCVTGGGSITNVNYGHQSSDDDDSGASGSSYSPYNRNSGTIMVGANPKLILLLLFLLFV